MTIEQFKRGLRALALSATCVLVAPVPALAQDEGESAPEDAPPADRWELSEPDTSRWRCRQCPFPSGWSGFAEIGVGVVSDDSTDFGDYRGLEEEGAFPVLGADLRYRGEEAEYAEILVEELGLDSRSLRVEGGRQGAYELRLRYDELPHFAAGDTRTVFSGAGSSDLTLPGSWVRANTTGGMTALDDSLRDVTIGHERETVGIGASLWQGDRWRYDLDYRETTKEGERIQGGSFLFRSALLPAPVDHTTEQLDASVAYVRERWQVAATYHASMFGNENDALSWDNPFTSVNGADRGRLALEPDNQFHQLGVSGSWRSRDSLSVSGRLAIGRMEQDEDFLAPSINSTLTNPSLPRDDLDGRVDTRTANLRIVGEPLERLTAKAELHYDERDNKTPRDSYVQVATDEILSNSRTNRPYSYEKQGVEGTLDYRVSRGLTISGSGAREDVDRTFQEVEQTETDTYWLEVRASPTDRTNIRLRRQREERDGAYEPLGLSPPENPDLRKFHIAERTRDLTRIGLDWLAGEGITVTLAGEFADDDYTDSDIGLTEAREASYSLDVSMMPAEGVTAYAFVSLQSTDSEILGADNVTGTPWRAEQDDRYRTVGIGAEVADLPGGFTRGGLDLTYAIGDTDIDVDKGLGAPDLPPLETRLYTLNLFVDRPLGKNADLRLGYLLEGFSEADFQLDGVDPDTIPTVLTLGEGTPGYTVHVIQASLRYEF